MRPPDVISRRGGGRICRSDVQWSLTLYSGAILEAGALSVSTSMFWPGGVSERQTDTPPLGAHTKRTIDLPIPKIEEGFFFWKFLTTGTVNIKFVVLYFYLYQSIFPSDVTKRRYGIFIVKVIWSTTFCSTLYIVLPRTTKETTTY